MHGKGRGASSPPFYKTRRYHGIRFLSHLGVFYCGIYLKEKIMTTKMFKMHIVAKATYLQFESIPDKQRFLWSYEMTIINQSEEIVQLLRSEEHTSELQSREN